MKKWFLLGWVLSTFFLVPSVLSEETNECVSVKDRQDIFDLHGEAFLLDGELTPFWAQEYSGADLAREALTLEKNLHPVSMALRDQNFDPKSLTAPIAKNAHIQILPRKLARANHGNAAANLALGKSPYAVGVNGEFKILLSDRTLEGSFPWMQQALSFERLRPDFTTISQKLDLMVFGYLGQKRISQATVMVRAAGNELLYDPSLPSEIKSIVVGSLHPEGWVTHYSAASPIVNILAPSDNYVMSFDDGKSYVFGGTSGASPQVAGALINGASVLGSLNFEQSLTLLVKTAIPTLNSYAPTKMDGVGLLNTYKLVEVAKRLRDAGWKEHGSNLLDDPAIYNFQKKGDEEFRLGVTDLKAGGKQVRSALKHFRKAFLLANHKGAIKELADLYRRNGVCSTAKFFENLDPDMAFENVKRMLKSDRPEARLRATRNLGNFGEKAKAFIETASDDKILPIREAALVAAVGLGKNALRLIEKGMSQPDGNLRRAAVLTAAQLPAEDAMRFFEQAIKNDRKAVQLEAVTRLIRTASIGEKRIAILRNYDPSTEAEMNELLSLGGFLKDGVLRFSEKAVTMPTKRSLINLKETAIEQSYFAGKAAVPFLMKATEDADSLVSALEILGLVDEETAIKTLETKFRDKDEQIRVKCVYASRFTPTITRKIADRAIVDESPLVRAGAAGVAGDLKDKALVLKGAKDKDVEVRLAALEAAFGLPPVETAEVIKMLMADKEKSIQDNIAYILQNNPEIKALVEEK